MEIFNATEEPIKALSFESNYGHGDVVEIEPGQKVEVHGPCWGKIKGKRAFVKIPGKVMIVSSGSEKDKVVKKGTQQKMQISRGKQNFVGVIIYHPDDLPRY